MPPSPAVPAFEKSRQSRVTAVCHLLTDDCCRVHKAAMETLSCYDKRILALLYLMHERAACRRRSHLRAQAAGPKVTAQVPSLASRKGHIAQWRKPETRPCALR